MSNTTGEEFVRGLLPGLTLANGSRLPEWMQSHLPVDTVNAAQVPAGVHLAFTGNASKVHMRIESGALARMVAPTLSSEVVAWQAEAILGRSEVPAGGGVIELELELGDRDKDAIVRVALPENYQLRAVGIRALNGSIRPAPSRPRLVVYGDSITQNWSVSTPGSGWTSRVAERLGFDLVNLGFAGSARGEVLTALAVAQSKADAVVLAWGTNSWSRVPTDEHTIAATLRLFLRAITQQLPARPVLVVSPLIRPEAETTPNAFGATLSQLRTALEAETHRFSLEHDLPHVATLPGLPIVEPMELVDGTHPGDKGNLVFASAVTAALRL